jgi:uncharacterized membrane protein YeaQ/YmgE (transglycosylase-associated protein family)
MLSLVLELGDAMDLLFKVALLIVVGFVAGWLAATLLGERRRYGILGYVVVGAIGAIGGNYAFSEMDLGSPHPVVTLVAAVLGSVVLVLILRLLRR